MTNPFNYPIRSGFGVIRDLVVNGQFYHDVHDGVDFAYPYGTPVTLPPGGDWDGTVIISQLDQYGGAWVDVRAADGGVGRFLHFSRIDVHVGDYVTSDQQLGLSGGVPRTYGAGLSTAPHLHIGLLINNRPVDPIPWLQKAYITTQFNQSDQLTMDERQQLNNFIAAKDTAINDPRFSQLYSDEQNAFGSWDGDDNPASNLQFLMARILDQRAEIAQLRSKLPPSQ